MERRKGPRFPLTCVVEALPARDPSRGDQPEEKARAVRGTVVNVSDGGACMLGHASLEQFGICRCMFHIPGMPVPLPLLTRVRWVESAPAGEGPVRIGLSFIA